MGDLTRALLERVAQALAVAWLVATACFVGLQAMPGDLALAAAAARYGDDRVNAANVEILRRDAGLDRPILVQYAAWMARMAEGDLGRSVLTGRKVAAELAPRLGVTMRVGGLAGGLALLLALPLGVAAGLSPGRFLDRAVAGGAAFSASTPSFVAGTLLIALLSIQLRWLPPTANGTGAGLVLPAVTLSLALLPGLARVVRHAVASVARAPYTVFARMRGVPLWSVAWRMAARPALVPVVAYLPVLAMHLLEGFVTVELVFNLDGIGTLLVRALLGRDLPVVMGAGVAFVGLLMVANIVTDILLRLLDRRPVAYAA
jgi:peptide/nickel transport system permease protein